MGGERELLLHGTKELLGQAAYGTLCILVLSSLRPVRRLAYQFFFVLQYEIPPTLLIENTSTYISFLQLHIIRCFLYHHLQSYTIRSPMDIPTHRILRIRSFPTSVQIQDQGRLS
jgi:hypothetical protein